MTHAELWDGLNEVFRDVMDVPDLRVAESTTANEVDEWDSITHVLLIVAVEKKFSVKFTAAEIQSLQNVGQLAALVEQKSL
jgi:acyl carrier protein